MYDDDLTEDEGTLKTALVIDNETQNVIDPPRKIRLNNAEYIQREMAAVYRDVRSGKIDSQEGTRLTYILDHVLKAHRTAKLEKKIEAIEIAMKLRKDDARRH